MARNFGKKKGIKAKFKSVAKKAAVGAGVLTIAAGVGYKEHGTVNEQLCKVNVTQHTDYDAEWNTIETYDISACGQDFKDDNSMLHGKFDKSQKIAKKMYAEGEGDGEFWVIKSNGLFGTPNIISAKHLTKEQADAYKKAHEPKSEQPAPGTPVPPTTPDGEQPAPTPQPPAQPPAQPVPVSPTVAEANASLAAAAVLLKANGEKLVTAGDKIAEAGQKMTSAVKAMDTALTKLSTGAATLSETSTTISEKAAELSYIASNLMYIDTGTGTGEEGEEIGFGFGTGEAEQIMTDADGLVESITAITTKADASVEALQKITADVKALGEGTAALATTGAELKADGQKIVADATKLANTHIGQPAPAAPAPRPPLSGEQSVCTVTIAGKVKKITIPTEAVGHASVYAQPVKKLTAANCVPKP